MDYHALTKKCDGMCDSCECPPARDEFVTLGGGLPGDPNGEQAALMQHTCENCGEKGGHWISTRGISLAALFTGQDDSEGFWTCPKLYGDDGRRLAA